MIYHIDFLTETVKVRKIREDTILKNFPLYCPKCRQETLIEVTNLKMTVIVEPDAKT